MKAFNLFRILLLSGFLLVTGIHEASAANLPPGFAEILIGQDLDPTTMALSPDGRLFVTEKIGRIRIIENGQMLTDPFLILEVDNTNERGLSGIAFDPDFSNNGYLYLYYTVKGENHNRISRFTANGNYAVPGSETVILDIDQLTWTVHNGGAMVFGPDGKLYISVGDGADGQMAQNMNSLRGKILRINSDGTIPEDNPFYNVTTGNNRAIYALGLRNSFSMTIQPGTGRIYATEVGASTWEEVNDILPGKNYGWPIIEGPINGQTPPENYKDPIFAYNHSNGCAAVCAAFYNPDVTMFPSIYEGKFFFADYCQGYIKYMDPSVPGVATIFATDINRPLNMVVAPDGTMYYLARAGIGGGSEQDNTATDDGTLWRIFYTGSGAPFVSVNPQSVLVSQGEDARFMMAASGEAPLAFQWQQNGIDIPGADTSELIVTNTMLSDSGSLFRCIVSNASGADTTLAALLRVTSNTRPTPEIITPLADHQYRGGETIFFSGHALDNEDGDLDPNALQWKIDFHHNVHTHPGLVPTAGITEGEFYIPTTGETSDDVWYRIHLRATDAGGLTKTVSRDIYPVKSQFNVETVPGGLPVYIEGSYLVSPVSVTSVVGIDRRVEVLGSAIAHDSIHLFLGWTDGETSTIRTFPASEDTVTFTALYESYPLGDGIGLTGYYYDGAEFDPSFYEPFEFTRLDTVVDFDWGVGSPSTTQLGDDFWLVRWEGLVQPVFDDTYHFHVIGDDGIRLWVNDQLLIDAWILQGPTEWTGNIDLEAGKQYPIRLEYFEDAGGAVCKLLWSSDHIAKSIIPRTQLFPESSTATDAGLDKSKPLVFYPNPVTDILTVECKDEQISITQIEIQNTLGQVLLHRYQESLVDKIQLDLRSIPAGIYWLKYKLKNGFSGITGFVKL